MSVLRQPSAYRVRETTAGVVIELPSPRRPITILALTAWLAGWVVGLAFMLQQYRGGEPFDADRVFLVAWAGVWLVAGLGATGYLAWLVAGRERITLAGSGLTVWRGVARWGVRHEYPVAGITELRPFGREVPPLLAAGLDLAGRGSSGVRFRCGGRVVRCARALDEHAARALVDVLRSHAPFPAAPGHPERPAA